MDTIEKDTLFLALTRQAMTRLGVPFEALLVNMMLSFFVGLWLDNPFYWIICIAIHLPMRVIASKDHNFFRIGRLWLMTKGQSIGGDLWGGSMLAPMEDYSSRTNKGRSSCV